MLPKIPDFRSPLRRGAVVLLGISAWCAAAAAPSPPAAATPPVAETATATPSGKVDKSTRSTPRRAAPLRSAARARLPSASRTAKPKRAAHDPRAARILEVAGLGEVTVYAPKAAAKGFALFASGDGGWNLGVWDMAQAAADLGYWVAGFSAPALLKAIERADGDCSDAATLLDDLGRRVRREFALPDAWRPVLIGYSSGATIVYAALAQAGDARFAGAMTLGFCPDLVVHRPFCTGAGLTAEKQAKPPYGIVFNAVPEVRAPWIVLQGEIDQVCNPPATRAFVAQVGNAGIVMLPKVGHGYGVPRNWMPQYRQGLAELLGAASSQAGAGGTGH